MKPAILIISLFCSCMLGAQPVSQVWVADNGDGTYKNPVIHADYSDPDAIRVGDDYYMVSSSFNHMPGLPILHSKDLVNWELIGHALKKLPSPYYDSVRHGGGVWAPSIRYHNGEFYIYYPDPDFGIYLVKAKSITGPWSDPVLVQAGKGLIDPCPLWDDNGKVYLVHAYAGSRAGIKSIIVVKELNREGTKVIEDAVMVYDGHENDPTIEGPKFYKRNGYYYIFAPAGGVSTGWQTVLRSKNVYGPYERKVVMEQGASGINGPHQGAWVNTKTGEDWFLHFQDKKVYGRVVHLQPMKWVNDWPVIGEDKDGDGVGQPVLTFKKPAVQKKYAVVTPAENDEFNNTSLGLQWQWQANPKETWAFPGYSGSLRLYAVYQPDTSSIWETPNILAEKLPAENFSATAKIRFNTTSSGDRVGLVLFGYQYATIYVIKRYERYNISFAHHPSYTKGSQERIYSEVMLKGNEIYLRAVVKKEGVVRFFYSEDGMNYLPAGIEFTAGPGKWVGAKIGFYCLSQYNTNDAGYADIDWFRVEKIKE